jgi:hypothetical protein
MEPEQKSGFVKNCAEPGNFEQSNVLDGAIYQPNSDLPVGLERSFTLWPEE